MPDLRQTLSADNALIWASVHRLTEADQREIERDNGTRTIVTVPSLWQQALDALFNTSNKSGERVGSSSERTPVDLNLIELLAIIRRMTRRELHRLGERPRDDVPAQLRQLANVVVRRELDQLWWWAYRFDSWTRMLSLLIAANEHTPQPVRLRNSPCPICGVRQVVIDGADGPVVAPPLLVDFRDGYVRAAHCTHCGAMWWRGAELETLAAQLGCQLSA